MRDDRSAESRREDHPAQEARDPVTPRGELHSLVDELGDEAVERLLAVLHAWRDRVPSLLYVCSCCFMMATC